jgi:NAD(P)-dependent dehydrogenase (short-subunit alcohol dehydrogenase family)
MAIFPQAKIEPLPAGLSLAGKVAVITGASSGLGFEVARQLLIRNLTTVILAVRNLAKAESCRELLLSDPAVKNSNPSPEIKIMKVDFSDYATVSTFAKDLKAEIPIIDYLLLNAGIGVMKYAQTPTGHESTLQVNYLSNALLLAELITHLEASSDKTGRPCRVSWVGSRLHLNPGFESKNPVKPNESILSYMDDPNNFSGQTQYSGVKCLCAMFMYELAPRLNKEKVFINMSCPGTVTTPMGMDLPIYIRVPLAVTRFLRARNVEEGAWVIGNATVVAGPEAHGRFLVDKEVMQ